MDEIRAFPKPHNLLLRSVKACAITIGVRESKKLLKTTFINNVPEFEAEIQREKLESNDYLGEDGVYETEQLTIAPQENRFAVCLIQWLQEQLFYDEFLPKVEAELSQLEESKLI